MTSRRHSFSLIFKCLLTLAGAGLLFACSGSGSQGDAPLVMIPAPESLAVSESYDEATTSAATSAISKKGVAHDSARLEFGGASQTVISVDQSGNATQYSVSLTNTVTGDSSEAAPNSDGLVYRLRVFSTPGDSLEVTYFTGVNTGVNTPLKLTAPEPTARISAADVGIVVDIAVDQSGGMIHALGNALDTGVVKLKTFALTTFLPEQIVTVGGDDNPLENAEGFECIAATNYCVVALAGTTIAVVDVTSGEVTQSLSNSVGQNNVLAIYSNTAFLTATDATTGDPVAAAIFYVEVNASTGAVSESGEIEIPTAVLGATPTQDLLAVNAARPSVHLVRKAALDGEGIIADIVIRPETKIVIGATILARESEGDTLDVPVDAAAVSVAAIENSDFLFFVEEEGDKSPLFRAELSIVGTNLALSGLTQSLLATVPTAARSLAAYQKSGAEECIDQVVLSLGYSASREARLFAPEEGAESDTLVVAELQDPTRVGLSADIEAQVCADGQLYFLVASETSGDITLVAVE